DSAGLGQLGSEFAANGVPELPRETDIISIIHMLTRLSDPTQPADPSEGTPSAEFQQQITQLTSAGQQALKDALLHIAENHNAQPDVPLLVQLAENLAIKFAMDRFQRGEVKVNAVREMMERMSREMESLRKLLNAHEDRMVRSGMIVESRADVLDRQFW